jgi:hypothetical protein
MASPSYLFIYAVPRAGLDVLNEHRHRGNYAQPRRFEIAAAINRLRTMSMAHSGGNSLAL